jgi:menaquinone-9 beta-reductase
MLAAETIANAAGRYSRERLAPYERRLRERFGGQNSRPILSRTIVPAVATRLLPWLLNRSWFTRRLVLDRWFLNLHQPALSSP